jgi:hypothetical protein
MGWFTNEKNDGFVDEMAKVPGQIFEGIVDGIMNAIAEPFRTSSSSSKSQDDKDSGGGLFCNVPSHRD